MNFSINKVDGRVWFLVINIAVSLAGFAKAFVFMSYLSLGELGVITLVNSSILLVSLCQLGLLNGGYRIFSLGDSPHEERINNTIYSYFLILFALIVFIMLLNSFFGLGFSSLYLIIGGGAGIAALGQNWLTNMFIAKARYKSLNTLNLSTAFLSIVSLIFVPLFKLQGALVVVAAPPFAFVIIGLLYFKTMRPTAFTLRTRNLSMILVSGFIPFLTGIFDAINLQLHNWTIGGVLGKEALGELYLLSVFTLVFRLIPKSLNNLFFPPAMRFFKKGFRKKLKNHLRTYYLWILIYIVISMCVMVFFLEPLIGIAFPKHLVGIKYIYISFPGLAAILLVAPMALLFNASLRLRPLLYAYGLSSLINVAALYLFWKSSLLSLESIVTLKVFLGIFILTFIFISFLKFKNEITGFYRK